MRIVIAYTVAVLLVAACAHAPPPSLHSAHLVVQRSNAGVLAFVHANVAGDPLTLLVDTGAIRSVLPTRFARAHNLGQQRRDIDDRMVDANGRISQTHLAEHVPVQFEGEPADGTLDFLVSPSEEVDMGILAPQDMVRPGWVVIIDLGRAELRYEKEEAALKSLANDPSAPLHELDFHGCLSEGLFERTHRVVSASINGVAASMLVDTGASHTTMARNNPALKSMLQRKGARGTTAAVTSVGAILVVPDVPIVVSQTSFVVPMLVEPASQICGEGLLGADILSQCTLVWGWNSLWAACRAPDGTR